MMVCYEIILTIKDNHHEDKERIVIHTRQLQYIVRGRKIHSQNLYREFRHRVRILS